MGKRSFLLLIAVFSSLSMINGAAIDNSEINLEEKLAKIIHEVNRMDMQFKYNVLQEKDHQIAEMEARVQKENETLQNDLNNFIDGKLAQKIQDKSRDCLTLSVSYKHYKSTAFTYYKDCLVNQLNMVKTKSDIFVHKQYKFINDLNNAKQKVSSCLELQKTDSPKAAKCLTRLTARVEEFQQKYLKKMAQQNVPLLESPPFEKCDKLYNGRSNQLNDQLQKCQE